MSTVKCIQEYYKELQNYSKHLGNAFDNSAPLRIFRSGLLPTLNSVAARISKGLPGQLPSFSFGTIGWPPKKLTRVTFEQLEQRQGRETGCSQPIRRALHEQQGPIYLSGPESFSETLDTPMISTSSLIAVTLPYLSTFEASSTEHAGEKMNKMDIRPASHTRRDTHTGGDTQKPQDLKAKTHYSRFLLLLTCHLC